MDTTVAPPTPSAAPARGSAPTPSGIALEPRFYTDPSLEQAEQELIFERTWQLAGHVSQLQHRRQLHHRRSGQPAGARRPRRARARCAPTSTSAAIAARGC